MGKEIPKRPPANRRKSGRPNPVPNSERTRWKPGQSGNPSGRPRTALLSQAVREKLGDLVPDDPQGRTFAQKIADSLIERAARGDPESFRALGDRAEGKPSQSVALTSTPSLSHFGGWSRGELRRFAETGTLPARFSEVDDENAGEVDSAR
jgi:hypothetical protein